MQKCSQITVIKMQKFSFSSKENSQEKKKAEMKLIYSETTTKRIFGIFECQKRSTKSVTKTEPNNELDVEPV